MSLTDLLLEQVEKLSSTMSAADLSTCFTIFAKQGIKFAIDLKTFQSNELEGRSKIARRRDAIPKYIDALVRVLPMMDSVQLANTIWSLGKSGLTWDATPIRIQKAISGAVSTLFPQFNAYCVANVIHGKIPFSITFSSLLKATFSFSSFIRS
jgi:hypothetical protein